MNAECRWAQDRLTAHIDGELDASESKRMEAHLFLCPACRSEAEGERSAWRRFREAHGRLPAPLELDARLAGLFDGTSVVPAWGPSLRWAAAAAFGFSVAFLLSPKPGQRSLPERGPSVPAAPPDVEARQLNEPQDIELTLSPRGALAARAREIDAQGEGD